MTNESENLSFEYNGVKIRGSPRFQENMVMLFEMMRKFVPYDRQLLIQAKKQIIEIEDMSGKKDEGMYSLPGTMLVKAGYLNRTLSNGNSRDLIFDVMHEYWHDADENDYSNTSKYPLPKGAKNWSEVPWDERPNEKYANDKATGAMINLTGNFNDVDEEAAAFAKFKKAFNFSGFAGK